VSETVLDDPTTEVSPGMDFDAARLEAYLAAHIEGFRGPLTVRQFRGGQSNPTYLLSAASGRHVLRRKPPGHLLASAHAVDREYRVIKALGAHTTVPVARTFALCTDDTVIGSWFYVMAFVEGRVYWDPALPELPREARRGHYDAMLGTLASLHRVDPAAVGLADYGRADGYLPRQVARWSQQYREDEAAGRIDAMDQLIDWLQANLPAVEPPAAIVHGDFRIDNLIFDSGGPRVLAVLDWELSTLGDPLADFAYHLIPWRLPAQSMPGLAGRDLPALGIPTEEEQVAAYCRLTGRDGLPDLDFYVAFCLFRLAGIFHGIRGRVLRGTAVSARARDYAAQVETMASLAWAQARRGSSRDRRR
jgi:aminoglycoside phosphotransferase (APT) family kinase protein